MTTKLTRAQAEAAPYFWRFTTRTDSDGLVVADCPIAGARIEFVGTDIPDVLEHVNAYEDHRVSRGLPTR